MLDQVPTLSVRFKIRNAVEGDGDPSFSVERMRFFCYTDCMSLLRVYLDTSVIGGCCDVEFARWSLALLRDIRLGLLIPVFSDSTESELAEAPPDVQAVYDELHDGAHERIAETPESIGLAAKYIAEGILTEKFRDDARHIAVAIHPFRGDQCRALR
jgi:hypothetical protein